MMHDWYGGWGPGGWVAMGLLMLAFWAAVAAVIVYVVRSTGRTHDAPAPRPQARPEDEALRILDERFARGDIDAEEYTHRRELLRTR
ncbi:MAG TPA: SHOCT domain-containing protein [Acidimicrobiia bacterium]|nr:SHOCT domain-containing protein [Acidimicrobiia bacterium]